MSKPSFFSLFFPLALISIFGLSTIYSATPHLALDQAVFFLVGILLFFLISRFEPGAFLYLSDIGYLVSILLLLLTYFFGDHARGSIRWLEIGTFRFQTSEFVKPLLILAFAKGLSSSKNQSLGSFLNQLIKFAFPWLLIFVQPDLGSSLILLITWVGMLFYSTFPRRYFLSLLLCALLVAPLGVKLLKPYQLARLTSFINPYSDPAGAGYNVIQSMIAVGSGQILGRGLLQGTQSHLKFLPEKQTDFAFASFAEEFGFIGASLLFTSFLVLLLWFARSSTHSEHPFTRLVTLGAFWLFFAQIVINLGMNMGILPVTGITLPFVSYGGSSVISLWILLSLVFTLQQKGTIIDI